MRYHIRVDESELNRLLQKVQKVRNDFKPSSLRKIFVKAARPAVRMIKTHVNVDTGALKKSIGVIPYLGVRTGSVYVGVRKDRKDKKLTTFYGKFLEFGQKHFKPKLKYAFLKPGAEASLESVKAIIMNELKALLR